MINDKWHHAQRLTASTFELRNPVICQIKFSLLNWIFIPYKVLVDTEMYNNGDVADEGEDLGNGVHLHILNRKEFPYK